MPNKYKSQTEKQNTIHQTPYIKYLFLAFLFLTAFLERTVFDLGPNIELVTAAMILTSFYLGKKESFWLTFAIMAFSDRFIGNSLIFIFTWSGFLIPALISKRFINEVMSFFQAHKKHRNSYYRQALNILSLTAAGLSANIFFFIWTNFGVWLIGMLYPHTFAGLINSYLNAVPFFRNQLLSTFIFIPLGATLIETAINLEGRLNLYKNTAHIT